MTKDGAGDVVFGGDNRGWTGTLTINDGRAVFAGGPAAFDGTTMRTLCSMEEHLKRTV